MDTCRLNHTITEACERLGVSRTTLYALRKSGELKFVKIGASSRVPESELQALQERLLKAAHATAKAA